MISSSCSTTITVLPRSRSFSKMRINRFVSLGCRPMLGSSSIYIEPTKLLPSEVAKLIRCDSPPDKLFDFRLSVRYDKPTSQRKSKRLMISVSNRSAICCSCLLSLSCCIKPNNSCAGISTKSPIDFSLILTYCVSFRSRLPSQVVQLVRPLYRDSITRF